jgi:hypothetical protein
MRMSVLPPMPSSRETMGDASVPQVRLAGSLVRKSSINEKKKFLLIPVFSLAIISSEKMHVKRWFFFLSSLGSIKACVLSVFRSNMVLVEG